MKKITLILFLIFNVNIISQTNDTLYNVITGFEQVTVDSITLDILHYYLLEGQDTIFSAISTGDSIEYLGTKIPYALFLTIKRKISYTKPPIEVEYSPKYITEVNDSIDGYPDTDLDGYNDNEDCDPLDISVFVGAPCDDKNEDTIRDKYDSECKCVGINIKQE